MKGFFPTNPAHLWNSNVGCKLSTCSLFFPFPSPPPLHFSSSNRIISDTLNLQPFNQILLHASFACRTNEKYLAWGYIYFFFISHGGKKFIRELNTRVDILFDWFLNSRHRSKTWQKFSEKLSRKLFTQQKCSKCCSTLKIIPQTKDCPFFVLVKTSPSPLPPP